MRTNEQPLSKLPQEELVRRLRLALQMLQKIASNKETWTLSETRRVIADITRKQKITKESDHE